MVAFEVSCLWTVDGIILLWIQNVIFLVILKLPGGIMYDLVKGVFSGMVFGDYVVDV